MGRVTAPVDIRRHWYTTLLLYYSTVAFLSCNYFRVAARDGRPKCDYNPPK